MPGDEANDLKYQVVVLVRTWVSQGTCGLSCKGTLGSCQAEHHCQVQATMGADLQLVPFPIASRARAQEP